MASQKRSRADVLKELKLAREGVGRAKQYKVCLVATALNGRGMTDRRYRRTQIRHCTMRLTKQSTCLLFEIGSIRTTLWRTTASVVIQTMEWIYSTRKKITVRTTRSVSSTGVISYVIRCSKFFRKQNRRRNRPSRGASRPRSPPRWPPTETWSLRIRKTTL